MPARQRQREPPPGSRVHRLHEAGIGIDDTTSHTGTDLAGRCLGDHAVADRRVLDPGNGVVKDLAALSFDELVTPFPHHPGPWRGYSNSSMRLVISSFRRGANELMIARSRSRFLTAEPPSRLRSDRRNAPHFLGVGLEEDAVELPAELRGDVPSKVVRSFGGRIRTQRYDRTHRPPRGHRGCGGR